MPLIIPDDIQRFTTPGEEIFCRFLRTVAKPDDRYIVWYSPDITDSEPDFACAFLVGVDLLEPDQRWSAEQIHSLVYVGITRARYQLIIPFHRETTLIEKLKQSLDTI